MGIENWIRKLEFEKFRYFYHGKSGFFNSYLSLLLIIVISLDTRYSSIFLLTHLEINSVEIQIFLPFFVINKILAFAALTRAM